MEIIKITRDILANFIFISAYDVLRPPGIINIKRDVMLWTPDGYEAVITLSNFQMFRHIPSPGWTLGWTRAGKEIISSIVGAPATDQGDCSKFKGNIPHSCERSPAIIDLFPGVHDNQKYTDCCKGGIVTSWGQDPAAAVSSFQVSVRLLGTSSTSVKLPRDFYLLRPGLGYTCSGATIMPPSVLFSADGRRKNRVMSDVMVRDFTYSQMIVSKYPTCCASFSSFYNPMITPCLSCACGGDGTANCIGSQGKIQSVVGSQPSIEGDVPLLQCTNHMCPIRWTLAAQNPNFNNITRVYKFDYKPHNAFGSLIDRLDKIVISFLMIPSLADDTRMFYGIKYYNDLLMQAGPEGNAQTEIILRKDKSTFTLDHGWAFSRKVYFNGDECLMPPPDKYPSLPSIAPSNPPLALALAFFLILVPMLLIF
ncbi:hypothetical protein ACJRO7_008223 [Eucalyptus globulus]|uniref:COBRA-like protein n=1 Tax=Eucalyptus globulus TaxID=34317 RepID=A0ABD3IQU2_EUCGL